MNSSMQQMSQLCGHWAAAAEASQAVLGSAQFRIRVLEHDIVTQLQGNVTPHM